MRNHLKSVHKKEKNDLDGEKDGGNSGTRQTTLKMVARSKAQLGVDMYNRLNRALALACALDLRQISMVTGRGFRFFVKLLNPSYQVPSAATVTKHLQLLYQDTKSDLVELLSGQQVSLTTDMWTSLGARGYITITAHFVTPGFKYVTKLIATRPLDVKHTGDAISKVLTDIAGEFGVDSIVGITTDNAANMVKAGKNLESLLLHNFCFSHTLQLAVEEGLKNKTISNVAAAGRNLVSKFHRSAMATHALKEAQEAQIKKGKNSDRKVLTLVQSVPTRWNSTYLMAERLLLLRLPIFNVLFDDKVTKQAERAKLDLSDSQWKTLETIVPILRPLAKATEALTKEDSPTLSQVPVLLEALIKKLTKIPPGEASIGKTLRTIILKALKKRCDLTDDGIFKNLTSPVMAACFLDPRHKSLPFLDEQQKALVQEYVEGLMPRPEENAVTVKQEKDTSMDEDDDDILACLIGIIDGTIDLTKGDSNTELQGYICEPVPISLKDPMEWWKVNHNR